MLRCPLHALLKRNGCCQDATTLALPRIQGKRVGEGARGIADRIRLSKITRVNGRAARSIPPEIPGCAIVLLHAHECHNARPRLIEENMLTIWQDTHHVRIIGIAATRISRGCTLNPVSHFQVRKFIQVAIGVKAEIERRGWLRSCGGGACSLRAPAGRTSVRGLTPPSCERDKYY